MKHAVPESALAEAIAIVGRTGSGKSYAARGLVERVLDADQRVCILDPTGVWHGLRKSDDPIGARYQVVIFGGDQADLPLTEANAAAVARLIAGERISAILDLADMTMGARTRLATAFADELYRINKQPLVLVADEADLFAPQRALPDQVLMLSRFEQIARRGRVRGFRLWCLTQRPAELHKSVLSQASTLIAMKLTAPQDRDAIGAWIEGQADKAQGKQLLATLPKLKVGEGFVWCPAQDILERVSFPSIKTADTMRAPEPGEDEVFFVREEIDVAKLRDALGPIEEELADNDPKALRARIRELERAKPAGVDRSQLIDEFERGKREGYASALQDLHARAVAADHCADAIGGQLAELRGNLEAIFQARRDQFTAARGSRIEAPAPAAAPAPAPRAAAASSSLPKAERLILTALAQYAPKSRTAVQVAILTGYAVGGGGFRNAVGALRSRGLVEGGNEALRITPGGIAELGDFDRLPHGRALFDHWTLELIKGYGEIKASEAFFQ